MPPMMNLVRAFTSGNIEPRPGGSAYAGYRVGRSAIPVRIAQLHRSVRGCIRTSTSASGELSPRSQSSRKATFGLMGDGERAERGTRPGVILGGDSRFAVTMSVFGSIVTGAI